jgi:hypothetical protein
MGGGGGRVREREREGKKKKEKKPVLAQRKVVDTRVVERFGHLSNEDQLRLSKNGFLFFTFLCNIHLQVLKKLADVEADEHLAEFVIHTAMMMVLLLMMIMINTLVL